MNTQVCQNCGSLIRGLSSKCSACGCLITKHSSTGVAQLSTGLAPHAVALANNPLDAEKMIVKLQHATVHGLELGGESRPLSSASTATGVAVLSPSVISYVSEIANSTPVYTNENSEITRMPESQVAIKSDDIDIVDASIETHTISPVPVSPARSNGDLIVPAMIASAAAGAAAGVAAGIAFAKSQNSKSDGIASPNSSQQDPAHLQESVFPQLNDQPAPAQLNDPPAPQLNDRMALNDPPAPMNDLAANNLAGNNLAPLNDLSTLPLKDPAVLQGEQVLQEKKIKPRPVVGDFFSENAAPNPKSQFDEPPQSPAQPAPQPTQAGLQPAQVVYPTQSNPHKSIQSETELLDPAQKMIQKAHDLVQQGAQKAAANPSKYQQELEQIRLAEGNREELVQRLVEANMNKSLPAESGFFEEQGPRKTAPEKRSFSKKKFDERNAEELERQQKSQSEGKSQSFDWHQWKLVLIGCVAIPILAVLAWTLFSAGTNKDAISTANPATIEGRYSYWFKDANGNGYSGTLNLHQKGEKISGDGQDLTQNGSFKPFTVQGVYKAPSISLAKRYGTSFTQMSTSYAIVYYGQLYLNENKKSLSGNWHLQKSGMVSGGPWRADLIVLPPSGTRFGDFHNRSTQTQRPSESNWLKDLVWNDLEPAPSKFMKILFGCILFGFFLVQVSMRFFGMHGLMNRWERERYLPVNLRPQHEKMMRELGAKQKNSLCLGERMDWNIMQFLLPKKLYLSESRRERNPHMLAIGAGAKGKTRFLASLAINDIKNGDRSVVVVDSDGSLVEQITRWLCSNASNAEARKLLDRVSIIDPCRPECSLGFNPLAISNAENLQALANSIVMGFKAIYTESQNQQNQWTQQTANILRNSIMLLILNGKDLQDLPTLLSDNDFRDVLLEKVEKNLSSTEWKTLIDAWTNYKRLARSEQWLNWIEPILNRVQPLLSDQRISRLLNAKDNSVDLAQILEEKRILLIRVPDGQLEKGGNLLGSLIITGLKQAALMHYERTGDSGHPCSLYVDEMNSFIDVDSFESICSDTRKVQIGIHGSLKTLQDLPEDYRNKVQVQLGSIAIFAISKKDADILGPAVFKVDGRSITKVNLKDVVNPVNSMPTMRLASDEEKMNTNRLVGQDERCYFFHLLGTEAGIFRMKAPELKDIPRGDVNWDLLESLYDQANFNEDEV